jgi:exodeoxyribonuclease VII small subunit
LQWLNQKYRDSCAPLGRIDFATFWRGSTLGTIGREKNMTKKNNLLNDGQPSAASTGTESVPLSFEQAIERLETIVRQMEEGSLSLNDSLVAYKEGAALISQCRQNLEHVEQQVQILEDGILKPFDSEA